MVVDERRAWLRWAYSCEITCSQFFEIGIEIIGRALRAQVRSGRQRQGCHADGLPRPTAIVIGGNRASDTGGQNVCRATAGDGARAAVRPCNVLRLNRGPDAGSAPPRSWSPEMFRTPENGAGRPSRIEVLMLELRGAGVPAGRVIDPQKRLTSSIWMLGPAAGSQAVAGVLRAAPAWAAAQASALIMRQMLMRFMC